LENKRNIALIFFSRTKADEAQHKSWFTEKSKNQDLASLLIEKSSSAIQAANIPVFHYNESNQKGDSFGERIANAYQEIFDLGYEQVISVGNDCIDLDKISWKEISLSLAAGKSVLGPNKRGGAYLIGIQKTNFQKKEFEELSWQKNTLYQELADFCKKNTDLEELNQFRDINSYYDLRLFTQSKKTAGAFFKLLLRLLNPILRLKSHLRSSFHDIYIFKDSPLRAPPIL